MTYYMSLWEPPLVFVFVESQPQSLSTVSLSGVWKWRVPSMLMGARSLAHGDSQHSRRETPQRNSLPAYGLL